MRARQTYFERRVQQLAEKLKANLDYVYSSVHSPTGKVWKHTNTHTLEIPLGPYVHRHEAFRSTYQEMSLGLTDCKIVDCSQCRDDPIYASPALRPVGDLMDDLKDNWETPVSGDQLKIQGMK